MVIDIFKHLETWSVEVFSGFGVYRLDLLRVIASLDVDSFDAGSSNISEEYFLFLSALEMSIGGRSVDAAGLAHIKEANSTNLLLIFSLFNTTSTALSVSLPQLSTQKRGAHLFQT